MLALVSGCTPYLAPPPGSSPPAGPGVHRVVPGETLWAISQRYGVSVEELAGANGISEQSRIETGQSIRIPGREPAPLPPVSPGPMPRDSGRFIWPVQGRVISIFGTRYRGTVNKGVDIQAPAGMEVVASRRGRVGFVHESLPGFGKTIILEHDGGFASVYAYVGEILVRQGEPVSQYQKIARVGKTGPTETPALHFEIRRNQRPQNPLHYLP